MAISSTEMNLTAPKRIVPIAKLATEFWGQVNARLVKVHRLDPPVARRALNTYRRRVGRIAMNSGYIETAADIAALAKSAGKDGKRHGKGTLAV